MIQARRHDERGHANHGWLESYHTFSFAGYYDPAFMGFRELRVINEDFIDGGQGFPAHPHADMEIITYIVDGALAHQDTLGNQTTILPGEVQRMSAGTGIRHSEYNPLPDEKTHLLQIWILPDKRGIEPSYGQKSFKDQLTKPDTLTLVASQAGREGSVSINQDVDIYAAKWLKAGRAAMNLKQGRYAWVQVIEGEITMNGLALGAGDAAAVTAETVLNIASPGAGHFLLFDLP